MPSISIGTSLLTEWFLAFAAAALYKGTMPTWTILDHAAKAIGAELEILVAARTTRRPTVDDQWTARCGAV